MFLNLLGRRLAGIVVPGTTRKRVLAGMLAVAAVSIACGSDGTMSLSGVGGGSASQPTAQPSEPAPSFVANTFNHGSYSLEENVGRPVLINFWFPSCPPCRAEMPDLQAAYEEFGDEVDFLGVQQTAVDTPQDGIDFLDELGIDFPNVADETAQIQFSYEVLSYPTTFFLNRDHTINREWTGIINEEHLHEQIAAIISS